MAANINDPISHCRRGQGGRTFASLKPKKSAGSSEANKRNTPSKTPGPKNSAERFPYGKYYDWYNDPDNLNAKLGARRLDKKKK